VPATRDLGNDEGASRRIDRADGGEIIELMAAG
jgi:hypothetical protein